MVVHKKFLLFPGQHHRHRALELLGHKIVHKAAFRTEVFLDVLHIQADHRLTHRFAGAVEAAFQDSLQPQRRRRLVGGIVAGRLPQTVGRGLAQHIPHFLQVCHIILHFIVFLRKAVLLLALPLNALVQAQPPHLLHQLAQRAAGHHVGKPLGNDQQSKLLSRHAPADIVHRQGAWAG